MLSLDDGLAIGLTIMAVAAGAPFLPKLAGAANGSAAFAWDIASSLIFLMLLPLALGLPARARYENMAKGPQPLMAQTSTIAIALLLVAGVIANFDNIVELIGTGGFIVTVLFLAAAMAVGTSGVEATRLFARCSGSARPNATSPLPWSSPARTSPTRRAS